MTVEENDLHDSTVNNACRKPDYKRYSNLVKASFVAIAVDLGLIIFKTLLANYSGNAVLLADALHSGGDLAVSFTVLISIIVHHSFHDSPGAKRVEAFAAFVISIGLIGGSLRMLRDVVLNRTFTYSFTVENDIPLVVVLIGVSVILGVTLVMARYKQRVGKVNDSLAFKAEGVHTYSDFLTSLGVWITLLIGYFGPQIGRVMSFLIALAVLQIGLRLFFSSFRSFQFGLRLPSRISILFPPGLKERIKTIRETIGQIALKLNGIFSTVFQLPALLIIRQKKQAILFNAILIACLYVGTGFYQVMPYQTGLELFLGRVVEKNSPGLHYHLPKPLGSVIMVDTEVAIRLESGFRTNPAFTGKEPKAYLWEYAHQEGPYTKIIEEALAITGDENLVDVNFLCYYRITNPEQYALENKNSHEMLRSLLVQNARTVLAHYQLDRLLAENRATVQNELLTEMKSAVTRFPLGVAILNVYMQEAHPPIEVIPQYRAVGSAREEKDHIIHKAGSYANDLIPRTKGKAAAIVLEAEGEAFARESEAVGQSNRFLLSQQSFRQNQSIHKQRLWWETVEKALDGKSIYVLPKEANRRFILNQTKDKSVQ